MDSTWVHIHPVRWVGARIPLSLSFGRSKEFQCSEGNDFESSGGDEEAWLLWRCTETYIRVTPGLVSHETVKHQRVNGISLKICARTLAQRKVSTQSELYWKNSSGAIQGLQNRFWEGKWTLGSYCSSLNRHKAHTGWFGGEGRVHKQLVKIRPTSISVPCDKWHPCRCYLKVCNVWEVPEIPPVTMTKEEALGFILGL